MEVSCTNAGNFSKSLPDRGADIRPTNAIGYLWNCIPNNWILAVILGGIGFEVVATATTQQSIWNSSPRAILLAVSFIVTFWTFVGLALNRVSIWIVSGCKKNQSLHSRFIFSLGPILLLVIAVMLYAISWGIFLQTSRFASWEVLRFTVTNSGDLWVYLVEAEPHQFFYGISTFIAVTLCFYFLITKFSHVAHPNAQKPVLLNRLWLACFALCFCSYQFSLADSNRARVFTELIHLSQSMNPALTFITSFKDSMYGEAIEPVLDHGELIPLNKDWERAVAQTDIRSSNADFQNMAFAPSGTSVNGKPYPSIIVIQVESLRNDVIHRVHQGIEVMPHLNRMARKGLEWKNAFAQATHSDYADPCIVSSLYPLRTQFHHYYRKDDPWPKRLSYDCLKHIGYSTAIISSQNEMWGQMEYFLDSPNLDLFYHPEKCDDQAEFAETASQDVGFYLALKAGNLKAGKFPDSYTADRACQWIRSVAQKGRPFLLNMNLQNSHFPYAMSDEIPRPFKPYQLAPDVFFTNYDPIHTETVRNAYLNSLHEIDKQIGKLVAQLEDLNLMQDTIFVIVGENGEAFHENGQVCHAKKPYNAGIQIGAVMYGPGWFSPGVEDYPIEHVDLLPTLFHRIGVSAHPNFQGIDALSPQRPELKNRFLFGHICSPLAEGETVQWAGRWKYMWDKLDQKGELYDLENDPGEVNNLFTSHVELAHALHEHLMFWRARQLAWYHFPSYYTKYFPPKPPKMKAEVLSRIQHYLD
ncbi:MAG: sulfatase-like hydrolase/transferase [Planctomycetota bacterium]